MITKPILPPRAGYVEVEVDGVRQYKKIETETDQLLLQFQIALAELAEAQAADQTNNELALTELADLIIGGTT